MSFPARAKSRARSRTRGMMISNVTKGFIAAAVLRVVRHDDTLFGSCSSESGPSVGGWLCERVTDALHHTHMRGYALCKSVRCYMQTRSCACLLKYAPNRFGSEMDMRKSDIHSAQLFSSTNTCRPTTATTATTEKMPRRTSTLRFVVSARMENASALLGEVMDGVNSMCAIHLMFEKLAFCSPPVERHVHTSPIAFISYSKYAY